MIIIDHQKISEMTNQLKMTMQISSLPLIFVKLKNLLCNTFTVHIEKINLYFSPYRHDSIILIIKKP